MQGASLGSDIEIDAKPIYEDDIFEIYYADSPRACIKYKGNIPYSWCVSRNDSSNMFYTYRFKQHEPAFYFVKVKDRTKKELGFFSMIGNVFNGQFKDKYHFFVLQVIKGTKIGDTTTKQYVVTSAMNDGDEEMSWNDIIAIEPRIANLQEIFKPIELSPEDKEFYNKFKNGTDDKTFCKLDYTSKRRYLDIYVMPPEKILTDIQFKCLPEDLMNLYIGFGGGLSINQFELIKSNKNLLKRYQQITEKKIEEFIKGTQGILINYTELLILPEDKRKEFIINLNSDGIKKLLINSSDPDKIINILNNFGNGRATNFINNAFKPNNIINYFLKQSSEPEKIFNILPDNIKDFVIERLSPYNEDIDLEMNLNPVNNFLFGAKNPEKIFDFLLKTFDVNDLIFNLDYVAYYDIINKSENSDIIINKLLNISGENFINYLIKIEIFYFIIEKTSEPEKIINIVDKITSGKGKEYIMKMTDSDIIYLLEHCKEPEKIKKILQQYGKLPKEETTTPMNEIFKSLTSLQEELNEQNKVNVKKRNLEKVKQFLLERKGLLNEDITSGKVIVYHRTGKEGAIEGVSADGYTVGKGAMYGVGVYTTYDLESQLKPNMQQYGNIIIESKVLSMDKFLIFDYDIAKKIYGNVNYTLDNQLRLILGKDWNKFKDDNSLKELIEKVTLVQYTAEVAKVFYDKFENTILKYFRGLVFTGEQDGKVLVSYDRKNVEPLRYTIDEAETWVNIMNKNIYERLKGYKSEERDTYIVHILNKLNVGDSHYLNNNEKDIIVNNIDKIIKNLNSNGISGLLNSSIRKIEYPDDIINIGGKEFIMNLDSNGIYILINKSENRDKIIDMLFNIGGNEFVMNLNPTSFSHLLSYSSDPDKIINIIGSKKIKDFIIKLNSIDIINLLTYSSRENRDKIINMLLNIGGKEFIMNLNTNSIGYLLNYSSEPDKIKQIFQQYGKLPKEETPMNEIFKSLTSLQEEVNFNSRFKVKNQFVELSKEDLADLSNEIINLINNAYKNIGGNFEFKEPNDLLNTDLTYWVGSDSDEDPYSDSVIGGKETKFGTKLTTMGQDGQMQSKADVLQKLRNLLSTKGFYIECDSFILSRVGLPPITDEETVKNVIGKNDIVFNSDGSYQRSIKGHISTKYLIGIPKYTPKTPLEELFNSMSSLQEELTEQRKISIKETNLMKVQNFIKKRNNNQ